MAETTGIAWCDSTFNPWIGCTKIGPGCDHCYAELQDSRKRWGGTTHWGAGVARHRTSASNWAQPLKWNKEAAASGKVHRVFCASLADVFDNEVPQEWRDDLWTLIETTPRLSWLLVTKRIGNVAKMLPRWSHRGQEWIGRIPENARLLITVCNQEEADRDIQKLLALPCKNGISYEPALSSVNWEPWLCYRGCGYTDLDKRTHMDHRLCKAPTRAIEWIIVGGESGSKARPFNLDWARSTIEQCRAAGVPVFVKQLGSHSVWWEEGNFRIRNTYRDRAGADPSEWPEDLRVRQFPT